MAPNVDLMHSGVRDITASSLNTIECISYVVNVYIDSLLCLCGFVSNAAILVILCRHRFKTSNDFLLQVLAMYDILLIFFCVLYTVLRSVYPATGHLEAYHEIGDYIVAYMLPCGWVAQTGTIWVTCVLAVERFLAVSKPFCAVRWGTLGNAKRLTVALTVFNILFNSPRFVHYNLVAFHTDYNATFVHVSHVKFNFTGWNSEAYHYAYHIALSWLLLFIVPLCILVYCNCSLIRTLKSSLSLRCQMVGGEKQRRLSAVEMSRTSTHVTVCIVVLVCKFILCQLPDFLLAVLGSFIPVNNAFHLASVFAQMLLLINSSVNFIIYRFFHTKFQNIMPEMCGKYGACCDRVVLNKHAIILTETAPERPDPVALVSHIQCVGD
ncbi:hypothetical protein CAPTEDRAFT_213868 [Capitella teleta]|uniref:G-protein coupled receptors family 1 profile domain-containing protein n=1 Tax=Capitella teleta TaxID=283909 RepID=R7U1Q8_CAPTE|nr:hypothetical protein CAPTEDRAFT_213868 [Capitella teleta]|eukprot:ELT97120.1 hypothetical protein CAPTEDRAFT_213868 [Capitella teleta]